MNKQYIFDFKTNISDIEIPEELNNPFGIDIPEIAKIAANEFQEFVSIESKAWEYDFLGKKGKMFGIIVIKNKDNTYNYLGTASGKLPNNIRCDKFIPSIFDDSADDFFINKGMTEISEICNQINNSNIASEIESLTEYRKQRSFEIQQQLFKNYQFSNSLGIEKNVLQIFASFSHGNPPSAAGECSAPKLLQFAFNNGLKPIAIAEFWLGKNNKERDHKEFYPACKSKCRPILEFMLDDTELYKQANEMNKA